MLDVCGCYLRKCFRNFVNFSKVIFDVFCNFMKICHAGPPCVCKGAPRTKKKKTPQMGQPNCSSKTKARLWRRRSSYAMPTPLAPERRQGRQNTHRHPCPAAARRHTSASAKAKEESQNSSASTSAVNERTNFKVSAAKHLRKTPAHKLQSERGQAPEENTCEPRQSKFRKEKKEEETLHIIPEIKGNGSDTR